MPLPVDKLEFWRDRVYKSVASGTPLHNTVYVCHPDVWQNIQNIHHGVLRRFCYPGMKVLDAGCGYGDLYNVMPEDVDYMGVDFSPELIQIARNKYVGQGHKFILGDLRDLSNFAVDRFDIAICRSIDGMVKDNLGTKAWEEIEAQLCRVAKRLLLLSYEKPAEYFLPSPRVQCNVAVACIPRTGSTMLWRSLVGLPPGDYTPKGYFGLESPVNIKKVTHYTESLPENTKVIFLFGKVPYSVISTRRAIYDRIHFEHCGYSREALPDIYKEDALSYERIFDEWVNNKRYRTLCVRYEALHESTEEIKRFLDVSELNLPPYRPRATVPTSEVDGATLEQILKTYESLIGKTREMPNIKLLNQ